MSSVRERTRNNVQTGIFVVASTVLLVAIVVVLSGIWTDMVRATRSYTLVFSVTEGVENLRRGAAVRVGGIQMGSVSSVQPRYRQETPLNEIEVQIRLDRRVTLYSDASVGIRLPLLGTDPWIEVFDVGGGADSVADPDQISARGRGAMIDTMLDPKTASAFREVVERIRTEVHEGDTLLAAVIGADAMERLRELIHESGRVVANAQELSAWMATLPDEYQLRVVPILDDAGASMQSVRIVTADLADEQWPAWTMRVDMLLGDLGRGIEDGTALVDDVRATMEEIRPGIVSVVQGADTAVQRINEETIDRLNRALDQVGGAITTFEGVMTRIGGDYPQWSSYVDESLSRLNLAAQQVQIASVEIRRSPWKLLYRPGAKELEHELLYEAARSFALAAGDLRAAGGAVDRLLDMHGERLRDDPQLLERLTRYLAGPLDRYEGAQRALFDLLLEHGE